MRKILSWWKRYAYLIMLCIMVIGLRYPMVMLIFLICMLAPLVTGRFFGRFWCGNLCPIGQFFDHMLIKISNDKKAPDLFRSKMIRIIFTALMMSMFIFEVLIAFGKPVMMGMIFYEMILEAVIIGTFLSVIYHNRVWCHFCPMGSLGALTTHYSGKKKVLAVAADCISCKKCDTCCPMEITPSKFKGLKISSYNCIQCGKCSDACEYHNINYVK